ncbi:MAG: hypothetical protein H7328_04870 [Bdellovibrio sp.]|nr:hypothetical protein [Bdellovibrio sp.]
MFINTDEKELNFYFFNPREDNSAMKIQQQLTYRFWHEIWADSFKEVDQISTLHSDDYVRSDYVGVLFYKDEPVLMCLYTFHDITKDWTREDSYFRAWPKKIFDDLQSEKHSKALVCSHYTLGKKYRQVADYKVKDLVLSFIHCIFQDTQYPILLATTRNSKKANQLMYSMGCEALAKDINYHGEPADLMILTRERSFQNLMVETDLAVRDVTLALWKNKNNKIKQLLPPAQQAS